MVVMALASWSSRFMTGAGSQGEADLDVFTEADGGFLEVLGFVVSDLPDDEVDEAHGEHVIGEKGELAFPGLVVRLKGIPEEGDVLLRLLSPSSLTLRARLARPNWRYRGAS